MKLNCLNLEKIEESYKGDDNQTETEICHIFLINMIGIMKLRELNLMQIRLRHRFYKDSSAA